MFGFRFPFQYGLLFRTSAPHAADKALAGLTAVSLHDTDTDTEVHAPGGGHVIQNWRGGPVNEVPLGRIKETLFSTHIFQDIPTRKFPIRIAVKC